MEDKKRDITQKPVGTYVDHAIPKVVPLVFSLLALVLVLVPFVGMLWTPTTSTTENHELAELPSFVTEEGSFNEGYLRSLGDYFDDHFAYRNQMVDANAHMHALFGVSATDQVVVGKEGWLYYGGTLPDYLGQSSLSDRSLANIAHNLRLAQNYVELKGATFAFTLAPNKNSLDWSFMPYYYLRYSGESNAERLKPYLDTAGVNYVDLFSYFSTCMEKGESFHYLKEDSHWDNYWALLATNELLSSVEHENTNPTPSSATKRAGSVGDLQSMLYPSSLHREDNYFYEDINDGENNTGSLWAYTEGNDVTDSYITTVSKEEASGSLLMFRDSFGNALLPFLATQFESATFSKLIPYNLMQLNQAATNCVLLERAERHLSFLATDPPIMESPYWEGVVLPEAAEEIATDIEVSESGAYGILEGTANEELQSSDSLFIVAQLADGHTLTFDPFWISETNDEESIISDNGFMLYVPLENFNLAQATLTVYKA